MIGHAIETWAVAKPAVASAGGVVASQHHAASDAGASVLTAGGNAVDAAIAASFVIGVVEPWMSGLGGGGCMLVYRARDRTAHAIDFNVAAPADIDPGDYPLGEGMGADLFNWPRVVGDRNLLGPPSICVPGLVAGLAKAHEQFGSWGWADLLAPAIESADAGMEVDWYATLMIASAARDLARYRESAVVFLPDGLPPVIELNRPPPRLAIGRLAETLRRLADAGPRDFYEGRLARAIVEDVRAAGGKLSADDMARYDAQITPATEASYCDAAVYAMPGLTGGPSLVRALALLQDRRPGSSDPEAVHYLAIAASLKEAYRERLATMGHANESGAPVCTTHLGVADREGNVVTLTQTLLSPFGSKVVLPGTGITMNNGIIAFDPTSGRANSIAPGARPLSNMCPTVLDRADGLRIGLGASGGRFIMPAVFQLVSYLVDLGLDVDAAIHRPRIDVSGSQVVTCDDRLPAPVIESLAARERVIIAPNGVYPMLFACPNLVGYDPGQGKCVGAAYVMSPRAKASTAGAELGD